MRHPTTPRTAAGLSALLALSLTLTACGEQDGGSRAQRPAAKAPAATVPDPLVASYDGGLLVLRGDTLKVAADLPLPGFLRVNPAGDGRHVLVSEADGFRALDAAAPALTGIRFPAADPGHVVHHAGRTALFADGSGEVTLFDPAALRDLPAGEKKPPPTPTAPPGRTTGWPSPSPAGNSSAPSAPRRNAPGSNSSTRTVR